MDFVTDTEDYHYYWVEKVVPRPDPTLWGLDIGEGDLDKYKGSVAFMSATDRWQGDDVSFGWGHVHSRGFFLTTLSERPIRYLEPPFLVVTDPSMRFIRSQDIKFSAAHDWEMLDDDTIPAEDIIVCGSEWIGRLKVDKRKSRNQGELWIFSNREDISLKPGLPLHFADGTSNIFGHLA